MPRSGSGGESSEGCAWKSLIFKIKGVRGVCITSDHFRLVVNLSRVHSGSPRNVLLPCFQEEEGVGE